MLTTTSYLGADMADMVSKLFNVIAKLEELIDIVLHPCPAHDGHFSTARFLAILLKHFLQFHCCDFRKALIMHTSMRSFLA